MTGPGDLTNVILHHVDELAKLFSVNLETDKNAFTYVEKLQNSVSTYGPLQMNPQNLICKLCDNNPHSAGFMKSYEELKLKNVRELVPLVYLFWRIRCDPPLFSTIERLSHRSSLTSTSLNTSEYAQCRKDVTYVQQLIADSGAATAASTHGQYISADRVRRAFDCLTVSQQQLSRRLPEPPDMDLLTGTMITRSSSSASLRVGGPPPQRIEIITPTPGLPATTHQLSSMRPSQPEWLSERPVLQDAYLSPDLAAADSPPKIPIESLSLAVQENAIVEDLIQLLHGSQGVYIKPVPLNPGHHVRSFAVDERMSPALLDTVNRILPLCSNYSTVTRFIQQMSLFEYGMVNQALAAAMRSLVKDYLILICQLEHQYRMGQLGIARLQFFLQDTARIFAQLARVATDISLTGCTGGAVLSLLYNNARGAHGVAQLRDLMMYLLRSASLPFFKILQKWIYRGIISDPYHEFFITSGPTPDFIRGNRNWRLASDGNVSGADADCLNDDYLNWAIYWEKHYSVVSTNVPNFLESHLNKILITGKYLNVVQQCADDACELPKVVGVQFDENDNVYMEQIDGAYCSASSLLLQLMIQQKDLKEHLKSVKRYFLLDQADFVIHFMDAAELELCKPSTSVSLARLSSLFELAIRTSTASVDPNNDYLKLLLYNYDLISQILLVLRVGSGLAPSTDEVEDLDLTALEAFCIDYIVQWPVSLVLNRQVMDRYQMLFRHLFYCKHVERLLCNSWVLGKLARRATSARATWFTNAYLLSQRMLTFIQHFQYYMTVEVIEPTWVAFFTQVDKASNLDALLASHLHCLEVCMDDCLLANPKLLKLFGKLCAVCVTFSNFIKRVISASAMGESMPAPSADAIDFSTKEDTVNAGRYPRRRTVTRTGDFLGLYANKGINPSRAITDACSVGSKLSLSSSTASLDTLFTKVTRDDFSQVGSSDTFAQTVVGYDNNFNHLLVQFLEETREQAKQFKQLSSLVSRLDFNQFYTQYAVNLRDQETAPTPRGDLPDDGASERQQNFGLAGSSRRCNQIYADDESTFTLSVHPGQQRNEADFLPNQSAAAEPSEEYI